MIPLRDSLRARRFPIAVTVIVALNLAGFLAEARLGEGLARFLQAWGVVPARFLSALDVPRAAARELLTVFSSMFLHGGFMHLVGNMWFLWVFGDNVEDRLGRMAFPFFYLACGAAAAASQVALEPTSSLPMIGASGAVAGVLGAYVRFYPRARVSALFPLLFVWFFREVSAAVFLGAWFLVQVVSSLLGASGVAWWAHIAGFLAGALLSLVAPAERGKPQRAPRGGRASRKRP